MAVLFLSKADSVLNSLGVVRDGGTVSSFLSGTSTPLATFSDDGLANPNDLSITLQAGRPPVNIFLGPFDYKFVFLNSTGTDSITVDPVRGAPDSIFQTPERFGPIDPEATEAAQAALDEIAEFKNLYLDYDYPITGAGLTLTNKSNIDIIGPGSLSLASANVGAVLLKLVGACDNVHIRGVKFEGESISGLTGAQYGIYSNSGQTLSNIEVDSCILKNLNAGISFNAASSGTYNNAIAVNNYIENIYGIGPSGQGYGIHIAGVKDANIRGNTIRNCQRHSIYVAQGLSTDPSADSGYIIADNIIRDHRLGLSTAVRPAIFVARTWGASVTNNRIIDYQDGGIMASHSTDPGFDCGNVLIADNVLSGRKNDVHSIGVGELADPTTNRTYNVLVEDNVIRSDILVGGRGNDISIFNCIGGDVHGNKIHTDNIPNLAYVPVAVGTWSNGGAADFDLINVTDNLVTGTLNPANPSVSPINFIEVDTKICSGASRLRVTGNRVQNELLNKMANFVSTQTNNKIVVQDQWGGIAGTYTAADLTPSVFGGVESMHIANASGIEITALDDGSPGQVITLTFADTNTTIKASTGNIRLAGGSDFVSTARDTLTLIYMPTYSQWFEKGRSVNS